MTRKSTVRAIYVHDRQAPDVQRCIEQTKVKPLELWRKAEAKFHVWPDFSENDKRSELPFRSRRLSAIDTVLAARAPNFGLQSRP
jgi:hypothetical protein